MVCIAGESDSEAPLIDALRQQSSFRAGAPSVQMLHVIPSGVSPRYGDMSSRIPATVTAVQAFLLSDVGRQLNVDPVIRTVAVTDSTFAGLVNQLKAQGFDDPNTIYLSFAETTGFNAAGCGITTGQHAMLLMPRCDIYPGAGVQTWPYNATYLTLHELLHALGAVPSCAPNNAGGGHSNDSAADIVSAIGRDWDNLTLDPGNDDYYGHSNAGCPDVEDSRFWQSAEPEPEPIDPCLDGWPDVPSGVYFTSSVQWATCNGITNGTSGRTFSPGDSVTRAQMATFLWRYASEPTGFTHPFGDVASPSYYEDAVAWMAATGITTGTGTLTFSPNSTVTRGQVATFLWRYAGEPTGFSHPFTDVASSAYYEDAVAWMASTGITTGTTTTTFSPDAPLTRAEAVTFLWRYADRP